MTEAGGSGQTVDVQRLIEYVANPWSMIPRRSPSRWLKSRERR